MKLQTKIFVPVFISLVVLGGTMYVLNRMILQEAFHSEIQKVLFDKEKSFNNTLNDKAEYLMQYSNMLSSSKTIRSAFELYKKTQNLDLSRMLINQETDSIKFYAHQSKLKIPTINFYTLSRAVLYSSKPSKRDGNMFVERKIIESPSDKKTAVSGIDIGAEGFDIRGFSPVIINNQFFGTVETALPLSQVIDDLKPESHESYALMVDKENIAKITELELIKTAQQTVDDNRLIQATNNIDYAKLKLAYRHFLSPENHDNIVYAEDYNHVFVDIKNFEGKSIGKLIYQMNNSNFVSKMNASSYSMLLIGIMLLVAASISLFVVLNKVAIYPIKRVTKALQNLSLGIVTDKINQKSRDEISEMQSALKLVNEGIVDMSKFAVEIANEDYNSGFEALSRKDVLGNTLIRLRDQLKKVAKQEQEQSKVEDQRKWLVEGQAQFTSLLQNNEDSIGEYSYKILSKLIAYLEVNQGAIFLLSADKKKLILSSSYAYDRRKFNKQEIKIGEGLLGDVAKEKKLKYLTDIPDDYINITSGLGKSNPKSLLMVPMFDNGELTGVYELASFRNFDNFEIEFCEKIAENISQSISRQKSNQKTKELLEQSQQQSEQLMAQEEEMRQNLEEMQATQEEMSRRESEMKGTVNALNSSLFLVEFDLNRNIINANDKILDLFKMTSVEQMAGKNHSLFFNTENYDEITDALWAKLLKKETVSRTSNIIRPNREIITLNETYSPVLDASGEILKIINISVNNAG